MARIETAPIDQHRVIERVLLGLRYQTPASWWPQLRAVLEGGNPHLSWNLGAVVGVHPWAILPVPDYWVRSMRWRTASPAGVEVPRLSVLVDGIIETEKAYLLLLVSLGPEPEPERLFQAYAIARLHLRDRPIRVGYVTTALCAAVFCGVEHREPQHPERDIAPSDPLERYVSRLSERLEGGEVTEEEARGALFWMGWGDLVALFEDLEVQLEKAKTKSGNLVLTHDILDQLNERKIASHAPRLALEGFKVDPKAIPTWDGARDVEQVPNPMPFSVEAASPIERDEPDNDPDEVEAAWGSTPAPKPKPSSANKPPRMSERMVGRPTSKPMAKKRPPRRSPAPGPRPRPQSKPAPEPSPQAAPSEDAQSEDAPSKHSQREAKPKRVPSEAEWGEPEPIVRAPRKKRAIPNMWGMGIVKGETDDEPVAPGDDEPVTPSDEETSE